MYGRPPPIQLLVCFEAAARLGGFKSAAAELSVTPSAVSQQVKALEHYLDTPLFTRHVRRIELTAIGEAYYQVAQQTLNIYATKHAAFLHQFRTPQLRISMVPFVAYEMVIPNLSLFKERNPDIDLRIEASMKMVDFNREPIDAGIRFGEIKASDSHLHWLSLGDCSATVVGSPALLEENPVNNADDLENHTLIRINNDDSWEEVARHLEVERIQSKGELSVDSYFAAVLAVEQGLGLAIGIFPMTDNWVDKGRLVCAVDKVPIDRKWYFVYPKQHKKKEQLLRFYDWLMECAFK